LEREKVLGALEQELINAIADRDDPSATGDTQR
jgi:hypothetical protein